MRISDWSSDVCSSDLPAPPSEKSPLGVRPREAADTAALTRDCSDCTAAPSDAVLAATEFAAACSAVFLNCSAAADRKSGVEGKSGSVRVYLGGRRIIKQKKTRTKIKRQYNEIL